MTLSVDPDPPLPLLVAGVPGVPGFNAFLNLRARHPGQVFGLLPPRAGGGPSRAHRFPGLPPFPGSGDGLLVADPEDPEALDRLFRTHGFRSVVDASGWCALKPCEFDPALARRLNVGIGVALARIARRHGARLARLSTDLVFSGDLPAPGKGSPGIGYREEDPVSPVTVYGRMMAEAEGRILEERPGAAVLRIALPMGPSLNGHAGAIDWIASRFRAGRPATLYFDEVRSNLYVQDLARALVHLLSGGFRGLLHLGGPRPMSLYRIAQAVNRVGDFPAGLLMGCPRAEAGPVPPRAGDVSMDSARAESLLPPGLLGPWPREEGHVPDGPSWHADRPAPFPAGSLERYLYGYGWPGADHPAALAGESSARGMAAA
jgi:dTDP-4-dehydrorhamnose reductase